MSLALDTNVLLYAANRDDSRNELAIELLLKLARGPESVYVFWPVIVSFMRIATRRSVFPNPLSTTEALGEVEALLELDHVYAPGEGERFWFDFREAVSEGRAKGDLVSDSQIVALMRSYGVRTIVTHDRDFRRFDGIRVRDPFA